MKTEKDTPAPLRHSVGQVVAVDESRPYSVTVQVQTFSEAAERAGLPDQLNAPFFSFKADELKPLEQKQ